MFDNKSRDIAIISGLGVLIFLIVGLLLVHFFSVAPKNVLEEVQAFRIEIRTEQNLLHEELNQRETITDSKLWQLIDANESLIAPDSWERPKD